MGHELCISMEPMSNNRCLKVFRIQDESSIRGDFREMCVTCLTGWPDGRTPTCLTTVRCAVFRDYRVGGAYTPWTHRTCRQFRAFRWREMRQTYFFTIDRVVIRRGHIIRFHSEFHWNIFAYEIIQQTKRQKETICWTPTVSKIRVEYVRNDIMKDRSGAFSDGCFWISPVSKFARWRRRLSISLIRIRRVLCSAVLLYLSVFSYNGRSSTMRSKYYSYSWIKPAACAAAPKRI